VREGALVVESGVLLDGVTDGAELVTTELDEEEEGVAPGGSEIVTLAPGAYSWALANGWHAELAGTLAV
jgi:hypothetical protein